MRVCAPCRRAEALNHRAVVLMARGLEVTRGCPSGEAVSGGEAPGEERARTGRHAHQHGLCIP